MKAQIELSADNKAYVQINHDGERLSFIETTHDAADALRDQVRAEIEAVTVPVGEPNAAARRREIANGVAAKFRG